MLCYIHKMLLTIPHRTMNAIEKTSWGGKYVGVAIYMRTNDRVFQKHGDKKL